MSEHAARVLDALRKAPEFKNLSKVDQIIRLGGLTNLVHRVDFGARSIIVRIPGDGTEAYIDRGVELYNARAAARAGVPALEAFIAATNAEGQAYYGAMGFVDYREAKDVICKSYHLR